MGSLLRSEEMTLCQLFLQSEAACDCLSELGELRLAQFRDLLVNTNKLWIQMATELETILYKWNTMFDDVKKWRENYVSTDNFIQYEDFAIRFEIRRRSVINAPSSRPRKKRMSPALRVQNVLHYYQAVCSSYGLRVYELRFCKSRPRQRKEGYLEKEIKKDGIPMMDTGNNPDAPVPREIVDLEATFEKLENEMNEVNANYEALKRNFLELTELKHNLRKTQTFFDEADHHHTQAIHYPTLTDDAVGLQGEKMQQAGRALKLGFVAGVILREKIPAFERMLWRVCRGNVFLRQAEIETPLEDPITGDQVRKSVCIIFFQGDQLKSKVKKICEGYRATLYPCPEIQSDRREMTIGVMTRIEDLNTVLGQTQDHRHRVLVAAAKNIKVWFIKVHKIKAIYHTLNMFNLDVTQKCLIAECWCPVTDLDRIQQALRRGNERSGSSVPSILNRMYTKEEPPTYNRTNKFTEVFQSLVDSYGVASYREINPAPYTIISFPFLFALMFGDSGHGAIVFLLVLYMVIRDKTLQARKIDNEIWDMFFDGRYIILLMGAFSIYTGLIYNDLFSKSINIFGSSWYPNHITYNGSVLERCTSIKVEPDAPFFKGPYPVGLDPVWQLSQNKITVTDSFKMKVSVIFGVTQMLFGVALSLPNHRHFKKRLNIFCEFIPQLIFMCSIFGYLIILIFVRWTYFTSKESYIAPNLLIGLINMFLMTYPEKNKNPSVHTFYPGQKGVQMFLVVLAVLCVPWMLLVKPCLLRHWSRYGQFRHQQLSVQSGDLLVNSDSEVLHHADNSLTEQEEEEPFEFGETLIHQGIHTIEYFLSCISHTASYLRLWALSLAHAQLSEVLWGMVMSNVLKVDGLLGAFLLVPAFSFWAFLTLVLLVLMEGLIAFLHALRLHWVEFQSKFYIGQGYKFLPFSFDNPVDYSLEEN